MKKLIVLLVCIITSVCLTSISQAAIYGGAYGNKSPADKTRYVTAGGDIQAAIDAVDALGGGVVVLAPGAYEVPNATEVTLQSNMLIEGYGATITLAAGSANTAEIFKATSETNITIRGITFDGNTTNQTGTGTADPHYAIKLGSSSDIIVEDCIIKNVGNADALSGYGVYGSSTTAIKVLSCYFLANKREDVVFFTDSNHGIIDDSISDSAGDRAWVIHDSDFCTISNSPIYDCGGDGIDVNESINSIISNCTISNAGDEGMIIQSSQGTTTGCVVTGCTIYNSTGSGLQLDHTTTTANIISDNTFKDCGSASGDAGVYLVAPSNSIIGNTFINCDAQGIYTHNSYRADNNYIAGNTFSASYNGSVTDAGSATVMTDSAAEFVVDALIGQKIINSTTGHIATITDNAATTVTVASITGDWSTGDSYAIVSDMNVCVKIQAGCSGTIIKNNMMLNATALFAVLDNGTGTQYSNTMHVRVTGIDAKDATGNPELTHLYTVPYGFTFYPTTVVITCTSFTAGAKGVQAVASFGGNSATYDDFLNTQTYTIAAADTFIPDSASGAVTTQAAGDAFKMAVEIGSDATTETWTVDLYGVLK